jgi:hypothetical protein
MVGKVGFDTPVSAVTPGQSVVLYEEDAVSAERHPAFALEITRQESRGQK